MSFISRPFISMSYGGFNHYYFKKFNIAAPLGFFKPYFFIELFE